MPVVPEKRPSGHWVPIFTCEICGGPACYGYGSSILRAMRTGNRKHAGKWYCHDHRPNEAEQKAA